MSIMHTQMPQTYYPQPQMVTPQQPVYQAPVQQQLPQPSPTISNIIYVQGELAAKAYPVAFGKGVVLFDSEKDYFYIKEVDRFGVPKPLRKFPYKEEVENAPLPQPIQLQQSEAENPTYVTRNELDQVEKRIEQRIVDITKPVEMVPPKQYNNNKKHREERRDG